MWDIHMFFYELRLAFSIFLLCGLWYTMGLLDWYLHGMFERVGSKILKVPVTAHSVNFYFPNTVIICGVHVRPPPPDVDNRWEWEDIITVDMVDVKFEFFLSAFIYFLSYGELAVMNSVCVHGLRFFVEGYRATPTDDQIFNVNLLGAKRPKRQGPPAVAASNKSAKSIKQKRPKPPTAAAAGAPVSNESDDGAATVFGKIESVDGYFSDSADSDDQPDGDRADRGSGGSTASFTSTSTSTTVAATTAAATAAAAAAAANGKPSLSWYFKSTTKALFHMTEKVKSEARQFNESVHEQGFLQASKKRLSHLYHNTKQSIELSIKERIKLVHTKLSGAEPTHMPGEQRFVCEVLVFETVEVHMLRALPIQIRHLEQKPLTVGRLQFDHLGYEGLTVRTKRPAAASSSAAAGLSGQGSHRHGAAQAGHRRHSPHHLRPEDAVQVSFGAITDSLIVAKDHSPRDGGRLSTDSGTPTPTGSMRSLPRSFHSARLESSAAVDSAASSAKYQESRHSAGDLAVAVAELLAEDTSPAAAPLAVLPELMELDPWSIDLYASGLDVLLFKYRFEQQMMLALYQGNAGRVIMDMLNLSHWNFSKTGIAAAGHGPHHSPVPAPAPAPVPAPPVRAPAAVSSYSLRTDDDFIYSNPLFLE